MEHNCLILHRKSANEPRIKAALKAVRKAGIELRVLVPFNKAEKPRVVVEALERGARRIIAGGGDGTINAVAAALVARRNDYPDAELGLLPLGTANDFARGCELPVDDLAACLEIACTRPARAIDVGQLGKRTFINVASAGFGAEVTATTPQDLKKALGGAAYTLMGLLKAFNLSPYTGRLLLPGQAPIDGEMLFLAVGNNRFAGGGFEVASQARLDDGLLDLVSLQAGEGFSPLALRRELEDPLNPNNRYLQYRQLEAFTIEADSPIHCNLDGEPLKRRRFRFRTLPGALRLAA